MCKNSVFIIIIALVIFLSSCSASYTSSNRMTKNEKTKYETIDKTEYYEVHYSDYMYYYSIFDKNHNIVKSGKTPKMPHISIINDKLVRVIVQSGAGTETQGGYYFDVENNVMSDIFYSIFDQNDDMVAFGNYDKVIVQNIFDQNKYYQEISHFSRPFSNTVMPIVDARFTDDGSSIQIKYLTGEEFEEVSENVKLGIQGYGSIVP